MEQGREGRIGQLTLWYRARRAGEGKAGQGKKRAGRKLQGRE